MTDVSCSSLLAVVCNAPKFLSLVMRTLTEVHNMSGVTGNLTTCGNVAVCVWVAAQHAITIFLIAHLAQKQRTGTVWMHTISQS